MITSESDIFITLLKEAFCISKSSLCSLPDCLMRSVFPPQCAGFPLVLIKRQNSQLL
ncbi:hypothetical protein HanIR_Chr17g0901961 [Helianthus annuus]|nr:hypothetical protein HanIR_Chr17g0901961 [Helianthus annuus]